MKSGNTRSIVPYVVSLALCIVSLKCALPETASPSRILLFIGDGMGPKQIEAAADYLGRPLVFQNFLAHASLSTHSADNDVTDSAAAATAMATGHKVSNGVISLEVPGSGEPLTTLLEIAAASGYWTGLITSTSITHATPAAFGAHRTTRTAYDGIASDYLAISRPNMMFGGGGYGLNPDAVGASGYSVAQSASELATIVTSTILAGREPYIAGMFGDGFMPYRFDGTADSLGYPSLVDMTSLAISGLDASPGGFFVMIESGLIDQAAHSNDTARMVEELVALDMAVSSALAWATSRNDVLILVTADHETGGIQNVVDKGAGVYPDIAWTTTGHSSIPVDAWAWGSGSERLAVCTDNTDIFTLVLQNIE